MPRLQRHVTDNRPKSRLVALPDIEIQFRKRCAVDLDFKV